MLDWVLLMTEGLSTGNTQTHTVQAVDHLIALPVVGRLVVVDVAFYTENVQGLKSLEHLDLNMAEIWDQKR